MEECSLDALIKLLDENLEYVSHEIIEDTIYINIKSNKKEACCSDCNTPSERIHSRYTRSFQDLPISGKKTVLILNNRKFFCDNEDCNRKTFAEKFDFIEPKAKKTKRLETEIINLSKNMSSISASKLLEKNVATVSKSTVCNIFKKRNTNTR